MEDMEDDETRSTCEIIVADLTHRVVKSVNNIICEHLDMSTGWFSDYEDDDDDDGVEELLRENRYLESHLLEALKSLEEHKKELSTNKRRLSLLLDDNVLLRGEIQSRRSAASTALSSTLLSTTSSSSPPSTPQCSTHPYEIASCNGCTDRDELAARCSEVITRAEGLSIEIDECEKTIASYKEKIIMLEENLEHYLKDNAELHEKIEQLQMKNDISVIERDENKGSGDESSRIDLANFKKFVFHELAILKNGFRDQIQSEVRTSTSSLNNSPTTPQQHQRHEQDVLNQQHKQYNTSYKQQLEIYQERHRQFRKNCEVAENEKEKHQEQKQEKQKHQIQQIQQQQQHKIPSLTLVGSRYEELFDRDYDAYNDRDNDGSMDAGNDCVDTNNNEVVMASIGAWERHSNGAVAKMMKNMNFGGKGLGVREDGIISPIKIAKKQVFDQEMSENKDVHCWPSGTVLIAGSSMLQGLQEKRLAVKGVNVKVRANPGATVRDMKDHLNAYLRKKPTHLILHVGANDSSSKEVSSDDIFDGLLDLKSYAENKVPGINVLFSCPTIRTDDSVASIKLVFLRNRLKRARQSIISNENITQEHLGKKGLHLNEKGVARLAKNLKAYVRSL